MLIGEKFNWLWEGGRVFHVIYSFFLPPTDQDADDQEDTQARM